jgi:hypothetical protein
MTQKLAVLQTPTLELAALVRQQLEMNPVLEADENSTSDISLEEAGLDEESEALWEEKFRQLAQLDNDWRAGNNSVSLSSEDAETHQLMLDSLTKAVTLTEHIANQVNAMRLDNEERADVLRLLGYLNDTAGSHSPWRKSPLRNPVRWRTSNSPAKCCFPSIRPDWEPPAFANASWFNSSARTSRRPSNFTC